MLDLSSATTSVSFSEYVITLQRSMRSTLMKVDDIRRRLFLLQESRRTSLSLDLDLTQLNVSQVVLRWRRETTSQGHHLWIILGMHTAQDRRHRETSCYFRIHKQERWLSKERTKRQTKNLFDCVCRLSRNLVDR